MRTVIQRVSRASVTVEGNVTGSIDRGLLVLVGVGHGDTDETTRAMAGKIARLRIFGDEAGKMNLSVRDVGGGVLAVSQFTLLADTRKGNRPSFVAAARPEKAIPVYERVADLLRKEGIAVETGEFGAKMEVSLLNSGPVTLILETPAG